MGRNGKLPVDLVEDLFDKIEGGYIRHIVGMRLVGTLMYGLQKAFGHYYGWDGAMVGGATGMTAVTMIFETTRDYDIVLPMILAVALSVGVRRLLSYENIYTLKLLRRGHVVPKALHANMFLVRRAREVMDKNMVFAPAAMTFREFPLPARPQRSHAYRHRGRLLSS